MSAHVDMLEFSVTARALLFSAGFTRFVYQHGKPDQHEVWHHGWSGALSFKAAWARYEAGTPPVPLSEALADWGQKHWHVRGRAL